MASKMNERLNFKSVEELLGVVNEESAMDIEICKISGFKGHPFKVVDDDKMQELVESIKTNGVLSPVLIRPNGMDMYDDLVSDSVYTALLFVKLLEEPDLKLNAYYLEAQREEKTPLTFSMAGLFSDFQFIIPA